MPITPDTVTYEPATNRVVLAYNAGLPDGAYRLTLGSSGVSTDTGIPLQASSSFDFTLLGGDANGDGAVNFTDLLALASSYGNTAQTRSQGDFNFDGVVNFSDLLILASHYGSTTTTSAAASAPAASRDAGTPTRIAGDVLA
ncbi:MAG: dockerin type I domain-containing protein [Tepidisphaeraceae bacterium]